MILCWLRPMDSSASQSTLALLCLLFTSASLAQTNLSFDVYTIDTRRAVNSNAVFFKPPTQILDQHGELAPTNNTEQ